MRYVSVMFRAPSVIELEEAVNRHLGHMDSDSCQVSISHAGSGVSGMDRFIACVTHGVEQSR